MRTKRLRSAVAVVVGLVAFGFGIAQADTGFSAVALVEDPGDGEYRLVCHVLNTGSLALTQVTITINSESGTQQAIQRFFNVKPGISVKEDVDFQSHPINAYCKVSVLNSTAWVGSLDIVKDNEPVSLVIVPFHQMGSN